MSSKETQERKVPVLRSDSNLIDQEFDSIREKFESEMSKMEEEMAKFRSQLINSERSRSKSPMPFSSSTSISSSDQLRARQQQQQQQQQICEQQKTSTSCVTRTSKRSVQTSTESSVRRLEEQEQQALNKDKVQTKSKEGTVGSWLDKLDSPLIKDSEAGKILKLQFDVSPYEPEQIVVRTLDNRLQVHAKREEKSENRSMYREYNREFLLPEGTDPELIKSSLSADGVLTVEAPLPISLYAHNPAQVMGTGMH